ncbi:MAG TPA: response regulator [Tepidisphaeraceae bacterium]|nr:response regulator [Tepidisphaeraceae bacterium]
MNTILAIDDSPHMHRLYRTALQRPGYRLLIAASGAEALLVMGNHFPDVILLDMAMPEMDGLTFLRLLREQPEWQKVPVIMITAFSTGEDTAATRHLDVVAHFVKSCFSLKQLRAQIDRCLCLPTAPVGIAAF